MHDTNANRDATKARIGPWYVLQSRNPAAPGMTYATLMLLVKKNLVTARSIVRGPTTHQLWSFAASVRGLSREFGVCWSCGASVEKSSLQCPTCAQSQKPPMSAEDLVERPGLAPRDETITTDDVLTNDTPSRVAPSAMDIVLPTPAEERGAGPVDAPARQDEVVAPEPRQRAMNGRILSDAELSNTRRSGRYESESPWRRLRQGVTVLLVTVGVVLGMAMMVLPDFRRSSLFWAGETFEPLMEKWRAWGESTRPVTNTEPPPVNLDGPPVESKPRVEARPKPGYSPRGEKPNAAAPTGAEPGPTQLRPSSTMIDEMVTQNLAKNIDAQARDAEKRGDFASAVSSYEQLSQLPQRFRPEGLAKRLSSAKSRATGP